MKMIKIFTLFFILQNPNETRMKFMKQVELLESKPEKSDSILNEWIKNTDVYFQYLIEEFNKSHSIYVKKKIAEALGKMRKEEAIPVLEKGLTLGSSELKMICAHSLGELKSERSVTKIAMLLKDRNDAVRGEAIWALGEIGDTSVLSNLRESLNDKVFLNRAKAIVAIAKIKGKDAIKEIIKFKNDPQSVVRIALAKSLGIIGNSRAVELLKDLTKDKDGAVRKEAFISLLKIGGREARKIIIEAMRDKNPEVRETALIGLSEISPDKAVIFLYSMLKDPDILIRKKACEVLDEIEKKSPAAYLGILKSENTGFSEKKWAYDRMKKVMDEATFKRKLLSVFPTWREQEIELMLKGKYSKGMSQLQIYLSLGRPSRIRFIKGEDTEEWDYDNLGLTFKFKNKKLTETERLILE